MSRRSRTILFFGNEQPSGNDGYGTTVSYITLTQALLMARRPEWDIDVVNRCPPGKCTVVDLRDLLEDDVLPYHPDVLCLMVGTDDARKFLRHESVATASWEQLAPKPFRDYYRNLLLRARAAGCRRLVLLEPFFITRPGVDFWSDRVLKALVPYRRAVRQVAAESGADFVPLHGLLQRHLKYRAPEALNMSLSADFPSPAGHMVIAEALYRVLVGNERRTKPNEST
jgi:acyl-CoA thioesterase I